MMLENLLKAVQIIRWSLSFDKITNQNCSGSSSTEWDIKGSVPASERSGRLQVVEASAISKYLRVWYALGPPWLGNWLAFLKISWRSLQTQQTQSVVWRTSLTAERSPHCFTEKQDCSEWTHRFPSWIGQRGLFISFSMSTSLMNGGRNLSLLWDSNCEYVWKITADKKRINKRYHHPEATILPASMFNTLTVTSFWSCMRVMSVVLVSVSRVQWLGILKGSIRMSYGTAGCFQDDGICTLQTSGCPNVPESKGLRLITVYSADSKEILLF